LGIFVTVIDTIGRINLPASMTAFGIPAQDAPIPAMRVDMRSPPFVVADFVPAALSVIPPSIALRVPRPAWVTPSAAGKSQKRRRRLY
jgi:hypothetical protein